MDVHDKLDELAALVESARAMPMSASCIVNRGEVLALLEEIRQLLPEDLAHAESLLQEREVVVEEGRLEASRLLAQAEEERRRLVSATEVGQAAHAEAAAIIAAAREEAGAIRQEVDDYVDTKLANFEVVLTKTLAAVTRGREKLRGQGDLADLGPGPGTSPPSR